MATEEAAKRVIDVWAICGANIINHFGVKFCEGRKLMKFWKTSETAIVACLGAVALSVAGVAFAQDQDRPAATSNMAGEAADADMATPDDIASPDTTPDGLDADAADPVLSNESAESPVPEAANQPGSAVAAEAAQ